MRWASTLALVSSLTLLRTRIKRSCMKSGVWFVLTLLLLFASVVLRAEDWPHWRGPDFNGISPAVPSLAKEWATSSLEGKR